jgi:hypothetical protein
MTTIRTKCPSCGDVDLAADAITMTLEPSGDRGEYAFTCPVCMIGVSKPATRRTAALLIAAGVQPSETPETAPATAPALAFEDLSPVPGAPALTLDDVIAFHFLLEDDIAIAEEFSLEAR